ncbi:MAG: alanine racemase [Coprothermobacterota bacterium]|nr:alanine racemase [Coprothermobacterota bacterium]
MPPELIFHLDRIEQNARQVVQTCRQASVSVCGVTKVTRGFPPVAAAMIRGGVQGIADARLINLARLRRGVALAIPLLLLRSSTPAEAEETVKWADISIQSSLDTLVALSGAALQRGRKHKVLLAVENGDLREGVMPEGVSALAKAVETLPGLYLEGLSTNYACLSGVLPTAENGRMFVEIARQVERTIGRKLDTVELHASVIEVENKPSVPFGLLGRNAFGQDMLPQADHFIDRGLRPRAILALGRIDIELDDLFPLEAGIEIVGASSDHLVVDLGGAKRSIRVGDRLEFAAGYHSILRASVSPYVQKQFRPKDYLSSQAPTIT